MILTRDDLVSMECILPVALDIPDTLDLPHRKMLYLTIAVEESAFRNAIPMDVASEITGANDHDVKGMVDISLFLGGQDMRIYDHMQIDHGIVTFAFTEEARLYIYFAYMMAKQERGKKE